jgi:hypothetical protein
MDLCWFGRLVESASSLFFAGDTLVGGRRRRRLLSRLLNYYTMGFCYGYSGETSPAVKLVCHRYFVYSFANVFICNAGDVFH